jgi:hypothetical protein
MDPPGFSYFIPDVSWLSSSSEDVDLQTRLWHCHFGGVLALSGMNTIDCSPALTLTYYCGIASMEVTSTALSISNRLLTTALGNVPPIVPLFSRE